MDEEHRAPIAPPLAPPRSGLRRWAGYFFQPCPGLTRTLGGSALAALVVGTVWFGGTLLTVGWSQTRALLPHGELFEHGVPRLLHRLHQAMSGPTLEQYALMPPEFSPSLFAEQPSPPWQSIRASSANPADSLNPGADPDRPDRPDLADTGSSKTVPSPGTPPWQRTVPHPSSAQDLSDTLPLWRSGVDGFVRRALRDDALPYSEAADAPLPETIKQIDFALMQTAQRLNLGPRSIQLIQYERRQVHGQRERYLFQRLRCYLPPDISAAAFATALTELLNIWSDRATLHRVTLTPERLRIEADGQSTHELFLSPLHRVTPQPPATAPLLTIVIDDLGANPEAARRLLELGVPLTMSIWPRAAHAASVADMAWRAGQEVLIHQPAEPLRTPIMQPGPGAVLTTMSEQAIAALVTEHLGLVPHATGLNNHMGSRFTLNERGVRALSTAAAAQGLFVLDSLTHPRSAFGRTAAELGITAYRRAVFLDDPLSPLLIRKALDEAERLARTHGQAIAIGHPHPETIDALRSWLRTRTSDVLLVPLRSLRPLIP